MPFTPIHLGPGAFFKGIGGDRFSFMVFGGSQVLMDIEPAYRMIVSDPVIHGPSHTLVGASVIGLIATAIGKPISQLVLRQFHFQDANITWTAAANGAFAGTFSHILFDAVMHSDMMPWMPLSKSNELLGLVSINTLHITCALLGILGAMLFYANSRQR
jgi:hypothetical protein